VKPSVIFVATGNDQLPELTTAFAENGIRVLRCSSIPDAERLCRENDRAVVVLDLDKVPVTNRALKELSAKCPSVPIIGVADRRFHPELKEAMRSYLYACMCKPVDVEELMYLVKSIFQD